MVLARSSVARVAREETSVAEARIEVAQRERATNAAVFAALAGEL